MSTNFTHTDDLNLINSCQDRFTIKGFDYKMMQSAFGKMNSVSDKSAGWDIVLENGTPISIDNRYSDGCDDFPHLGVEQGEWEVRTTDRKAARIGISEITGKGLYSF
tara:strand:- start:9237 stop:9557 length:321 start_codon:yes stop_codon:yes gene_type:complete